MFLILFLCLCYADWYCIYTVAYCIFMRVSFHDAAEDFEEFVYRHGDCFVGGVFDRGFPEVIEDDSISVSESGRKVIKEGEGLGSDEKNAAYEEMPDEDDVFADVVPVTEKEKMLPEVVSRSRKRLQPIKNRTGKAFGRTE